MFQSPRPPRLGEKSSRDTDGEKRLTAYKDLERLWAQQDEKAVSWIFFMVSWEGYKMLSSIFEFRHQLKQAFKL